VFYFTTCGFVCPVCLWQRVQSGSAAPLTVPSPPCSAALRQRVKIKVGDRTHRPVFRFMSRPTPAVAAALLLLPLLLLVSSLPRARTATQEEFDPFHEGQDLCVAFSSLFCLVALLTRRPDTAARAVTSRPRSTSWQARFSRRRCLRKRK
jgi:hypothetical protein